ncbi:iron-containing alcohol dehydrogenase [Desulfovibrio sp.]|uniref:iron-containing alcohol dehydrogenase n=1 Tax=Desulfovibrio sp. TaxID=885 RepID=UPI0025C232D5|nr:iron-containing alcohol dehydrogenase [Desulfovibrio sp.]
MWDESCNYDTVQEIRVKTTVYLGVGAINKIDDILAQMKHEGISSILCVSGGRSYKVTGAWDKVEAAAKKHGITLALYNRVTPNPTTDSVDEAAELGRTINAGAVICIGGGSPIDCGKSAAILLANPGKTGEDIYCFRFTPEKALPIIAINLTHGTGSEVNRFAVATVTKLNYKPAIAYDCIYPRFAIDDPALMTGLSEDQTRYVSIDAVNHVVEAATTTVSNPFAVNLAKETIRLVHGWLPKALENPTDLKARYELSLAALQAGVAFDNGLLHFTHALEHPLSAVSPDLSHGLGLAVLLPAVIKECYAARAGVLAYILEPIAPGLAGVPEEADAAAKAVEQWLFGLGVTQKLQDLGVSEADVDKFCDLVEQTPSLGLLLSVAPVKATREHVARIYMNSLRPMA